MYALGLGLATLNQLNEIIEVYYPYPQLDPSEAAQEFYALVQQTQNDNATIDKSHLVNLINRAPTEIKPLVEQFCISQRTVTICLLHENTAPQSVAEAYLKLHLLSHRLVKPHHTDLSGIFSVLKNIAWTNEGAIDMTELTDRQFAARQSNRVLSVHCVDKFPKMTDYVVPPGVRIADTSRVRLGAYLGEGTTIMHEGFVNFNAGTEGPNMIEGRISAGVWVAADSDLGGGCSIMGTLSGGGNIVIFIGKSCLIGANAGTGIALGDFCTIEAGLYITAGTRVELISETTRQTVKASVLSGKSNLLFRRHSQTGIVECLTNDKQIVLNPELHTHN